MSLSSSMLLLCICLFFFVVLFTLEGISDEGTDGIKARYKSISICSVCTIITLVLYFLTRTY